jgi:hypothetical protein
MSRLLQYINEDIVEPKNLMDEMNEMEKAISLIKHGWWSHIPIWRGFGGAANKFVIKVTNDESGWGKFRGSLSGRSTEDVLAGIAGGGGSTYVLKAVGLKLPPIFCTTHSFQAKFFGRLRLVIPIGEFKTYYNKDVHDILVGVHIDTPSEFGHGTASRDKTKEELKEVIDGYKVFHNTFPPIGDEYNEVILECKEYYLIYPAHMLSMSKRGKFRTIKSEDDIKTYKDVVTLYNEWRSYFRWFTRMRAKEMGSAKQYIEWGYPPEWYKDIVET